MPSARTRQSIPTIGEVMTPFPYAIDIERNAVDVERMLRGRSIRHLPVTSAGEVYSVLSSRDLELALARSGAEPRAIGVRELCARDPYIVDVAEPLDRVLAEMAARQLECALVAQDDRVAGIFTSVDACRTFSEWLRLGQRPAPTGKISRQPEPR